MMLNVFAHVKLICVFSRNYYIQICEVRGKMF